MPVSTAAQVPAKKLVMPRKAKRPQLELILEGLALRVAFEVSRARWPNIELGYVGTDRKTFKHYFQQRGNPDPFIL